MCSVPRLLLVSSLLYLAWHTCAGARRRTAPAPPPQPGPPEEGSDQNLRFMLSLYRSAAGPDGRPKQRRKFGSNTVRLLKPSASSVRRLPAPTGEREMAAGCCRLCWASGGQKPRDDGGVALPHGC